MKVWSIQKRGGMIRWFHSTRFAPDYILWMWVISHLEQTWLSFVFSIEPGLSGTLVVYLVLAIIIFIVLVLSVLSVLGICWRCDPLGKLVYCLSGREFIHGADFVNIVVHCSIDPLLYRLADKRWLEDSEASILFSSSTHKTILLYACSIYTLHAFTWDSLKFL